MFPVANLEGVGEFYSQIRSKTKIQSNKLYSGDYNELMCKDGSYENVTELNAVNYILLTS
jgi:hypothetical protein